MSTTTKTAARTAGAALLLSLMYIGHRHNSGNKEDQRAKERPPGGRLNESSANLPQKINASSHLDIEAPATWVEAISTLSRTLRFTYSETLGKWGIGELAFGIKYLMRKQGYLQVANVYAGVDSVRLKGPDIVSELKYLLRLLTLCMLFSKKPFPVFLESAGYAKDDVLLQKPKGRLLKPAFTIVRDQELKCFLLLIRGTQSIRDTLTSATGVAVPFHPSSVSQDGGLSDLVSGCAHSGMVGSARWIAKLSTPCLLQALNDNPGYKLKIVGHSLGGGTAALLTYILREHKDFCSSTCVTFAPAACMTWELAESGKQFVTSIINGYDLVPTFSSASADVLRHEVTASSWLEDLRHEVEKARVFAIAYRSATAIGSRLPSLASARARVASAGTLLNPVSSNSKQTVMKRDKNVAQDVARTHSNLSSWSSKEGQHSNLSSEEALISSTTTEESGDHQDVSQICFASSRGGELGLQIMEVDKHLTTSTTDGVTEGELWYQLDKGVKKEGEAQSREEQDVLAQDIHEEAIALANAVENQKPISSSSMMGKESSRFYPPGKIMHLVPVPSSESGVTSGVVSPDSDHQIQEQVAIYETPRYLYGKIRLARKMITDHYMTEYKKMMELLISDLENESLP